MTYPGNSPRSVPTIRLGVVGHRDLEGVDRAVLTTTVTRFLGQLRDAVGRSLAIFGKELEIGSWKPDSPIFVMVNPLAEGADQLVAEVAVGGGFGYRLRCPIPFTAEEYKSYFTHDRQASVARFDRLVADPGAQAVLIELACSKSDDDRGAGYAAAADVLLDNSDLLLALHDPSRAGSRGGTAETIAKAVASGLSVIGVDLRSPQRLETLSAGAGAKTRGNRLSDEQLDEVVRRILLPVDFYGRDQATKASGD